jgi:hypothetical protein
MLDRGLVWMNRLNGRHVCFQQFCVSTDGDRIAIRYRELRARIGAPEIPDFGQVP